MADVKWIKIVTDIFDDEKILLIESLPSADSIIVIWFKLLCLAGKNNNSGVFIMNDKIPYTDEMLATIFRRDINTVRLALKTFENYGMIEIVDGVYSIPNWGKHQTLDKFEQKTEYMRKYMQEYREKQRKKIECKTNSKTNGNSNCKANVSEADIELDNKELDSKDKKELEREKELDNTPPLSPSQGEREPEPDKPTKMTKKAVEEIISEFNISDYLLEYVHNWLDYKKERRFTYKERGLRILLKTICENSRKYGDEAVAKVISQSISNGYQGITFDSIPKIANSRQSGYGNSKNEQFDRLMEQIRRDEEDDN